MQRALIILLVLLAAVSVLLFYRSRDSQSVFGSTNSSYLMKLHIIDYDPEGVQWEADVQKAIIMDSRGEIELKGVRIYYPSRSFTVEAEEGVYSIKNNSLVLKGRIKGQSNGLDIYADRVRYEPDKKVLYAYGRLSIKGKGFTITADEGVIRDSNILMVTGNVRTIFNNI
jgi:LPS export ABC transporter protein LptC